MEAAARVILVAHAFEERKANLAAVGVSGEDEVNGEMRGGGDDARVVGEKNDGTAARNALERAGEIGVVPEVVHAGDVKLGGAGAKDGVAIAKDFDAVAAQGARDKIGAHAEIVIAENGIDATAGAKTAKKLAGGVGEIAGVRDEVAGEGDDIGLERVGELDGGEQCFR